MSVTGWNKKKKIKKVIVVSGIVGIPLTLAIVILMGICLNLSKRLEVYEADEGGFVIKTGYVLKTDKKMGEKIQDTDLGKVQIVGEKESGCVETDLEKLVGKCCKTDLKAGELMVSELLAKPENYGEDLRKQTFSQIATFTKMEPGELVDIRISFATGEDYVVAGRKEVLENENPEAEESERQGLTFYLNEEELLRISSALIDMENYPGTYVYAIPYVDGFQQSAYITYPMNAKVLGLLGWDPNVDLKARVDETFYEKESAYRKALEGNLQMRTVELNKDEMSQEEEPEVYEDMDETIEYFP